MRPTKPLSEYTTRALLAMREYPGGGYDEDGNLSDVSQEEIFAELNKREHIPNKAEAKVLRQQRGAGRKRRKR